MKQRVVFGETEPPEPVEDDRPRRSPVSYPAFDFEGRPRCIECGAPATADGTHECRDCREVRVAHHG